MSERKKNKTTNLENVYHLYNKWVLSNCPKDKNCFMKEIRLFTISVSKKDISNESDKEDFAQDLMLRILEKLTKNISKFEEFRNWYYNLKKNDKDKYYCRKNNEQGTFSKSFENYIEPHYHCSPLLEYEGKELDNCLDDFSKKQTKQNRIIFERLRKGYKGHSLTTAVNTDLRHNKFTPLRMNSYKNKIVRKLIIFLGNQD